MYFILYKQKMIGIYSNKSNYSVNICEESLKKQLNCIDSTNENMEVEQHNNCKYQACLVFGTMDDRKRRTVQETQDLLELYNKNINEFCVNCTHVTRLKWNNMVLILDTGIEVCLFTGVKNKPCKLSDAEKCEMINYQISRRYTRGYTFVKTLSLWEKNIVLPLKTIIQKTIEMYKKDDPSYNTYFMSQCYRYLESIDSYTDERIYEFINTFYDELENVDSIDKLISFIRSQPFLLNIAKNTCSVCTNIAFDRCGNCGVWYCSKEHQLKNWKQHRSICKK